MRTPEHTYESREKKETHETPILTIHLTRHGPKLDAVGEKDALAGSFGASVTEAVEGMHIPGGEGLVHVAHSSADRAVKTAEVARAVFDQAEHRQNAGPRTEEKLTVPFQKGASEERHAHDFNVLVGLQGELAPGIRREIMDAHPDVSKDAQETMVRNQIDMKVLSLLFDSEHAQTLGLKTGYEELADALKDRYSGFLAHTGMLERARAEGGRQPLEEPYHQVDISHSFPIMCFLKKYLVFDDGAKAVDLPAHEFFARTGGVIPESSVIELSYVKEQGAYIVKAAGTGVDRAWHGTLALTA